MKRILNIVLLLILVLSSVLCAAPLKVWAAPIVLAASNSSAPDKAAANAVCSGTSDQTTINTYLVTGNTVELQAGTYNIDGYLIMANCELFGQTGNTTILNMQSNTGLVYINVSGAYVHNLVITGNENLNGGLLISNGANALVSGVKVYDVKNYALGGNDFEIYVNGVGGTITGTQFVRCDANNPDGFGFIVSGENSPADVFNTVLFQCTVENAAVAGTRTNVWATGIDVAEDPTMTVNGMYVINCTVNGSWESDYHMEADPTKSDVVITGCIATNAGLKTPTPTFGAGFLIDGRADVIMNNNYAATNYNNYDLRWWDGVVYNNVHPLVNEVFPPSSTKIATAVSQVNCSGVIITTSANHYELVLYSNNGGAVTQTLTLPNGNVYAVSFSNYDVETGVTGTTASNIYIASATSITSTTATLNGGVSVAGSGNLSVTLYWGTTNGGNVAGNWANSSAPTSPIQPQGVSAFYYNVTGLAANTTYYFNAYAVNSYGGVWAGLSMSFTTQVANFPIITISAATSITSTSATLNGNVSSIGGSNPTITFYWGTADGDNHTTGWQGTPAPTFPSQPQGTGAFYVNVTGLLPNTTYYFNASATNTAGTSWATATSLTFKTQAQTPNTSSWNFSYLTNVTDTSGVLRTNVPVLTGMSGSSLAATGYMSSTGLDTAASDGTSPSLPYGVYGNNIPIVVDTLPQSGTVATQFYTGASPLQTSTNIIVGNNGYITVPDTAALEPASSFSIVVNGYVNTTAGATKNIVSKASALQVNVDPTTAGKIDLSVISNSSSTISQATNGTYTPLYAGSQIRTGERYPSVLSGDKVSSIQFYLKKSGSPTGTAYCQAWDSVTDVLLGTIGTLDVSTLTASLVWTTFNTTPVTMTPDCRIGIYYAGGDGANYVAVAYQGSDAYASGSYTQSANASPSLGWTDYAAYDMAWQNLTYYPPVTVNATGVSSGVHTITAGLSGGTLSLQIDASAPVTTAFAGGVPDTTNNWVIDQNNVMPYITSYSETVSGVQKLLYQPNAISLPDTAANSLTYPAETASTFNTNGGSTTGYVTLPSGVGYGELLLVIIGVAGNPTITPPTGWSLQFSAAQGTNETLAAFWKIATGSEGTSATFTLSVASTYSVQSYIITNGTAVGSGTATTGAATTNPAPPSVTGSANILCIPVACDSVNITAPPSGYTSNGVTGNVPYLASAYAQSGSTASPGVFTAASGNWVANTIYVVTAPPIILVDQTGTKNAAITLGYNSYILLSYGAITSNLTNGSVATSGSLSGFSPAAALAPPNLMNNGSNLTGAYGNNSTIWGVISSFMGSVQSAGQMPQQSQLGFVYLGCVLVLMLSLIKNGVQSMFMIVIMVIAALGFGSGVGILPGWIAITASVIMIGLLYSFKQYG